MSKRSAMTVLVATDGSAPARTAVATTVSFPWPRSAKAYGVVARHPLPLDLPAAALPAIEEGLRRIAAGAQRMLAERWPDTEVTVAGPSPVEAIVRETRRRRASVIVLGSRGRSGLPRILLGSVSLSVAKRAPCSVLLVKRRVRPARGLVIGVDGSADARRALALVARLAPPRGAPATVVRVVEAIRLPSLSLLPSAVQSVVGGEAAILQAAQLRSARREVEAAAGALRKAGWRARSEVRVGTPQRELLRAVKAAGADVVVVGWRGRSNTLERFFLGGVAEALLRHAPVSVLVTR